MDTEVEKLKNTLTRDSFEKKNKNKAFFPNLLSQRLQNTAELEFRIRYSLQWFAWVNTKQQANKCAIPNAQSNRDWLRHKQYLYLMWLDHEHHRNTTTMCKTGDQARVLWYLTPLAQSRCLRVLIATWTALERHWKDLRHLFLVFAPRSYKCFAWQRKARNLAYTLLTFLDSYH